MLELSLNLTVFVKSSVQFVTVADMLRSGDLQCSGVQFVLFDSIHERAVIQNRRTIDFLGIDELVVLPAAGSIGRSHYYAKLVSVMLRLRRDTDALMFANYFSRQMQVAASVLRPDSVMVHDEGHMTHLIPKHRRQRWESGSRLTESVRMLRTHRPLWEPARVEYISAYDLGDVGARDSFRRRSMAWLKGEYEKCVVDKSLGHILGTPVPDSNVGHLQSFVERIVASAPEIHWTYLPHRGESRRVLEALSTVSGLRLAQQEMPYELLALSSGVLPARIDGFGSSAVANLWPMIGDRVEMHAFVSSDNTFHRSILSNIGVRVDTW